MVSHQRNFYYFLPANAAAFILLFAPFTAAAITTGYSSSNTRLNQELAVIYKSRSAINDETLTKNVCAGWCQAYPGCTAYSYYFRTIDKFAECKIGPSSTSTQQRTGATVYSKLRMNLFGGEACELQRQCNTSSMMSCVNNVCTCPSTHTLAMDGQQCLPRLTLGISDMVYNGCDPGRVFTSSLRAMSANAAIETNLMGLFFYSDGSVNFDGFDVIMAPF
ncbi:unnamed protein product [Notodromas monacha]|uniref:Apple domain-containing protein n=1 Tax=Notodromas monacha TaxID=399045 RepID=A0A7R9BK34_9CRUS|nr:unnamed protein product [Notodromas monacha]CAG0916944.1 unnamed protein product [Notodromas monacha]